MRSQGIRIVVYGIVVVPTFEQAMAVSNTVKDILSQAGFVVNTEKSRLLPSKVGTWLGFDIDLGEGKLFIPKPNVEWLKAQLRVAVGSDYLHAKVLASIIGKIISMGLATGSVTRLRTRSLYATLQNRQFVVGCKCQRRVGILAGRPRQSIWHSPSAVRLVYSDASDTGFGGYLVEYGKHVVHGQWTETEARQSSTWREIRAVTGTLESIAHKLSNQRVRWFTDNQNVARIIQVGSRKELLQLEALNIFELAVK